MGYNKNQEALYNACNKNMGTRKGCSFSTRIYLGVEGECIAVGIDDVARTVDYKPFDSGEIRRREVGNLIRGDDSTYFSPNMNKMPGFKEMTQSDDSLNDEEKNKFKK